MSMPPPPPPGWQPGGQVPSQPPGFQVYPANAPVPDKRTNSGMAIAGMVCSLVGLVPCFWLFQIMGVLGVIFGSVGLKQTRNGARGGRGMAMAGVVIGIVLVLLCVVFWIYFANNANCVRNGNRFDCTTK